MNVNGKVKGNKGEVDGGGTGRVTDDGSAVVTSFHEESGEEDVVNEIPEPLRMRGVARLNSVILPDTGQRVQRTLSFFNRITGESPGLAGSEREPLIGGGDGEEGGTRGVFSRLAAGIEIGKEMYRSEMVRNVLKCSIGYFIASLGVYYTPFDTMLGDSDSKHVVATVAVYFHPSRTKGSMFQTLGFVILSLIFTFSVSFACRSVSSFFFNKGQDEVSYAIDLIISSVSLGLIAFMKQKVNKLTFNTACSLASISVVACIIKEGSLNSADIPMKRLVSTVQVVVAGCLTSVLVCFVLWPVSAIDQLSKNLNDSYNIMSSLLSITTSRFLTGDKFTTKDCGYFATLKKNISNLNTSLEEASYELKFKGREKELEVLKELVATTVSLLNNLQALRSSTEMQWKLLHEKVKGDSGIDSPSNTTLKSYTSDHIHLSVSTDNLAKINSNSNLSNCDRSVRHAIDPAELFDLFVHYLAPSIKSFIFTIKSVLSEIPFEDKTRPGHFVDTLNFQTSLQNAVDLFHEKQAQSFQKLYTQEIFLNNMDAYLKVDQEEVTACCGNFASLLGLFTEKLIRVLKLADAYEDARSSGRRWNCFKFWRRGSNDTSDSSHGAVDNKLNRAISNFQSQIRPGVQESSRDAILSDKLSFELWKFFRVLKRIDVQFGLRVGLGAFCLSCFAFHPKTKQTFTNWRLEWSLAIYCIMMNKSLGGTTMTVKWRFIGTFLGAWIAYLIWISTDGNVYALSVGGFLLSIPCFYIIIYWKRNNPFGRFILLTYNLTALYSYSMIQHDSEDGNEGGEHPLVGEIAFHRFIAVSIGVVWALVMASFFLPNSARSRLKNGLVVLWLRMGILWNSDPLDYIKNEEDGEAYLVGLKDNIDNYSLLFECDTLLKQAPLEVRLKGTFPKQTYEKLLTCTSTIIDAFQNMELMIDVEPRITTSEKYVLDFIEAERHELESRIFVIFYMIASALKLSFPIPHKPASTEHAKDRMLVKLNDIRQGSLVDSPLHLTNEDYVLLYSYILVTSTIAEELDKTIHIIQDLLGNISEDVLNFV